MFWAWYKLKIDNNKITIEDENIIDDFNETLLNIKSDTIEEVTESLERDEKSVDIEEYIAKNKWQVYKNIADIFTKRSENDNKLKKTYSLILVIILVVQLVAMNVIFILRGSNVLVFSDGTFNLFISATIAEVFTLVTIIVKYLFTDNLTNLLNDILTDTKIDKKSKKD